MGETPEAPESTTEVVVVDNSGGAPAPPTYVTSGELDAKLDSLRTGLCAEMDQRFGSMSDRVSDAQEAAYDAQASAADAEADAGVAIAIAETVAETAEQEHADGNGGKDSAVADEPEGNGDDGPSPPERRTPKPDAGKKDRSPWKGLFPNG